MADTTVPNTGWGSRGKYQARLCRRCGSENLVIKAKFFWKCEDCGFMMSKHSFVAERRVHQ